MQGYIHIVSIIAGILLKYLLIFPLEICTTGLTGIGIKSAKSGVENCRSLGAPPFAGRYSCRLRWYGTLNMDQKVFLNMVKKDQLCAIALKKRN